MPLRFWLLALIVARTAGAEPRRIAVDTPPEAFSRKQAAVAPYLYLNRCSGGCAITGGTVNDATMHLSNIPKEGSYTVSEFENAAGETGAAADDEWNQV